MSLFLGFGQSASEFEESISMNLNLESLRENPVLDYDIADSILGSIMPTSDPVFVGRFYNLLGRMNLEKGNYAIALEYFNTADGYLFEAKSLSNSIHNLLDKGNVYYKLRDFQKAEENYQKAIDFAFQTGDSLSLAIANNNLGLVSIERGNFDKADAYFQTGYQLRKNSGNHFLIGHSLQYLGTLNFRQGELKKALEYFNKARNAYERVKTKDRTDGYFDNLAKLCNDMGYVHARLGNNSAADVCASDALEVGHSLSNPYTRASISLQAAKLKLMSGSVGLARGLLEDLLVDARQFGFKDILQKSYSLLAEIYEKEGDYKKAMELSRMGYDLKETLETDRMTRKLADERFSYEVLNNRRKLELAEKESLFKDIELGAQERITQLLILLFVVALLAIGALFYSNAQKRKINDRLFETNNLIETQNEEIKSQQTELTQAKRELEEKLAELESLSTEKSMLINIVAHDLRNPLNSILGLCDLLDYEQKVKDPAQKEYLDLIRESAERMLGMINNLLNIRKIESSGIEIELTGVEVLPIFKTIQRDFNQWLSEKNISLNLEGIDEKLRVKADKDLLYQVLENLVSNAVKYSPKGSMVQIFSQIEHESGLLSIRDFGAGISADDQKLLFKKFQRLSTQPTGGEQSVGLGLSLVKHLTERMGGTVKCDSKLGQGSTFTISLSLSE
jgi:signal transduction histidine kinase/Flp pilus assembly protein TadD